MRDSRPSLVEGEDFYMEGTAFVFTARYHLRRGSCCESGCRHCPYRVAANIVNVVVEDQEHIVEERVE